MVTMNVGDLERPAAIAYMLLSKLQGNEEAGSIPYASLVDPEILGVFDAEEFARVVGGYGVYTEVDYVSPCWARVLLMHNPDGGRRKVRTVEKALAMFLRYSDDLKDWRFRGLRAPSYAAEELPT
jgi:hypothetical protein